MHRRACLPLVAASLLLAGAGAVAMDLPTFLQPAGVLKNSAGVPIDIATNLRFLITPSDVRNLGLGLELALVGLQSNTNYFYVWDGRQFEDHQLVCDGGLVNNANVPVPVNGLAYALLADFDNDGSVDLFGWNSDGYAYVWSLKDCQGRYTYAPWGEGFLRNRAGVIVTPDKVASVFADAFGGPSQPRRIRAYQRNTSYQYTWQISRGATPYLTSDTNIFNGVGAQVPIDSLTMFVSTEDPSWSNEPGGAVVTAVQANVWVYRWANENHVTPITAFPTCAHPSRPCAGKTLVFSLDQTFSNGLSKLADPGSALYRKTIGRVLDDVQKFRDAGYKTQILFAPTTSNITRLLQFARDIADRGLTFILDAYTSDSTVDLIPNVGADLCLGVVLDPTITDASNRFSPEFWAVRFGRAFAGIRIMETYSMLYSQVYHVNYDPSRPKNIRACDMDPFPATSLNRRRLLGLVEWAHKSGRTVQLSDNKWFDPYACYHPKQSEPKLSEVVDKLWSDTEYLLRAYVSMLFFNFFFFLFFRSSLDCKNSNGFPPLFPFFFHSGTLGQCFRPLTTTREFARALHLRIETIVSPAS
jgi:hypothetical protein